MIIPEIWEKDVLNIRQQLREGVSAAMLADEYVTTARRIARIGYGIENPDVPGAIKRQKGDTIPAVRDSEAAKIVELRGSGWSYIDLCDQFGLAYSTIANICCGRSHTGERNAAPNKKGRKRKRRSLRRHVEQMRKAAREEGSKPAEIAERWRLPLRSVQAALYGETYDRVPGALEPPRRATWLHGERTPRAKLTEEQVKEIRRLRAKGQSYSTLGQLSGVAMETVAQICQRRTWQHLPEDPTPARGLPSSPATVSYGLSDAAETPTPD